MSGKVVIKRPAPKGPGAGQTSEDTQQQAVVAATAQRGNSKLVALNETLKVLGRSPEEVFDMFDQNKDQTLNFTEFCYILKGVNAGLSAAEAAAVFDEIDVDKDKRVNKAEFLAKISYEAKKTAATKPVVRQPAAAASASTTKPTTPAAAATKPPETKPALTDSLKKAGTSIDQVNKQVEDYLSKVTISEADRFNGNSTILNDPIKCLKRCEELVKNNLVKGRFRDPDFGPDPKQIQDHGYQWICYDNPYVGAPIEDEVLWASPDQIAPGKKCDLIIDGATSTDVNQGLIGDCWLISAMSIVAIDDNLITGKFKPNLNNLDAPVSDSEAMGMISGIFPPVFSQYRKYGMYVVRFFKNFAWRYIIIDDLIPCQKGAGYEVLFASSTAANELWVPLLEKAYAKLHGRYQALISGDIADALVDFTGYVAEKVVIQNNGAFNTKVLKSPDNLWDKITKTIQNGGLLGCSIVGTGIEHAVTLDGMDTGLVAGHAYSLQAALTIKDQSTGKNVRVVQVRNPWGAKNPKEWTGAWSDNSDEMLTNWETINAELTKQFGKEAELFNPDNKEDGNFYMSFEDFNRIFCKLSVCIKFAKDYHAVRFADEWTPQNAGGTPTKGTKDQMESWKKNTQYFFSTKKKTHLFVSLGQNDGRLQASDTEVFPFPSNTLSVVICVFKANGEEKISFGSPLAMCPIKQFKEVSIDLNLEPGNYMIVPSALDPRQLGKYYLNIYHNGGDDVKIINLDTKATPQPIPEESETPTKMEEQIKRILKIKASEQYFS